MKVKLQIREKMILGSLIASIGLGKWGSYIGFPGGKIFLIDVFFLIGTLFGILGTGKRFKGSGYFYISVLFFIFIQFLRDINVPFFVAIRDLLPFIYLLALPACSYALKNVSETTIVKSLRLAAVINLSWFLPSSLGLLNPLNVPALSQIPLFTERADQSGIAMGIGVIAWSAFPSLQLKSNYFVISLCIFAAGIGRSRAGLFTALLALLLLFFFKESTYIRLKIKERFIVTLGMTLATLGILFAAQFSNIAGGNSSLVRAGIVGDSQDSVASGDNTTRARLMAAKSLTNWVSVNEMQLFGAGPGREMVIESGAVAFLSGNVDVRSPHNWFLGLYSRFGVIGFIYWCSLIGQILFLGRVDNSQLQQTLRAIVLLICFCSSLGVIMESPFGALPMAVLLALYVRRMNRL
jgi:hypothetical protein